jgi:hypothetical protein
MSRLLALLSLILLASATNCVHGSVWWFSNAEAAYPPIAPINITNHTLPVVDAAALQEYVKRGATGANGLDQLAAALLTVKLNTASGAGITWTILVAMNTADHVLVACPPDVPLIWGSVLQGGTCSGQTMLQIRQLIAILTAYSYGEEEEGPELCTDIGMHAPTK